MPTNYKFRQNGIDYNFDDVFVPKYFFTTDESIPGSLWIWGDADYGQPGTNDITDKLTPVTTFAGGNNWVQITCSRYHTTAIKTDGSLWTWGYNNLGQLGTNDQQSRSTPVTTFAGGNDWKYVASGGYHTLAIKTDGSLWSWGRNESGALGNNTSVTRLTPVTTFAGGNDWKSISGGGLFTVADGHSFAIKTDGSLWVWGGNSSGQLGTNDTTNKLTPVTTFAGGNNWKQISCGQVFSSAIKTDGSLWVWGGNGSGQLGTNDITDRLTPVTTFAGGNEWRKVSLGRAYSTAIKTDGSLWLWGNNSAGQLGTNDTTNRSTPVTTFAGGNNWKQLETKFITTAATKLDGSLWLWGSGSNGRLGTNDTTSKQTPVTTFAGGNDWKYVASGGYHTVAVRF